MANPESVTPAYLTVEDVARDLQLCTATVRTLAKRGELPSFKVGQGWRFPREAMQVWCAQQARQRERRKGS